MKFIQTKNMIYYFLWVLVGGLFFSTFLTLYQTRWDALGYTHAFFILPVSLGLAFFQRKELKEAFALTEKRFGFGYLIVFVVSVLMYVFGWRQGYMFVSTLAIIPFLYGFIGFIYGHKVCNLLIFPILYLIFLVPPPFALLDQATLPMRYISAFGVEGVFKLFHYPITREGLMYNAKGHPMIINEACSGFRSLITMFSLGVVYVYTMKSSLVKKIVLVGSIIPLAIIGNIVRIIIISLITVYLGEELAQGFLHSFSGIVVFLFIVIGFLVIEKLWAVSSRLWVKR